MGLPRAWSSMFHSMAWLHSCSSAAASPVPCSQCVPEIYCPQGPGSALTPKHSLSPRPAAEAVPAALSAQLPWQLPHCPASPSQPLWVTAFTISTAFVLLLFSLPDTSLGLCKSQLRFGFEYVHNALSQITAGGCCGFICNDVKIHKFC